LDSKRKVLNLINIVSKESVGITDKNFDNTLFNDSCMSPIIRIFGAFPPEKDYSIQIITDKNILRFKKISIITKKDKYYVNVFLNLSRVIDPSYAEKIMNIIIKLQ
jgi:hypothetical protein